MRSIDDLFDDEVICLDRETYDIAISLGHRVGQAYFNCLGETERNVLRHTKFDPFYKNDAKSVEKAHKYLKEQLTAGAIL